MTYRLRNLGLAIALAAGRSPARLLLRLPRAGSSPGGSGARPGLGGLQGHSRRHVGRRARRRREPDVDRDRARPGRARALLDPADVASKVVANPIYKGEQVSQLRFNSEAEKGIRASSPATSAPSRCPARSTGSLGACRTATASTSSPRSSTSSSTSARSRRAPPTRLTATRVVSAICSSSAPREGDDDEQDHRRSKRQGPLGAAGRDGRAGQKLAFVTRDDGPEWTLQLRPPLDASDSPEGVETVGTILGDGLKVHATVPPRSREELER